jgi:hypothetical protein
MATTTNGRRSPSSSRSSFIIPIGKSDYISIPMPLGFQLFLPNIGRLAVEMAWYKDKTAGKQMAASSPSWPTPSTRWAAVRHPCRSLPPTVLDPFGAGAEQGLDRQADLHREPTASTRRRA